MSAHIVPGLDGTALDALCASRGAEMVVHRYFNFDIPDDTDWQFLDGVADWLDSIDAYADAILRVRGISDKGVGRAVQDRLRAIALTLP